MKVTDFWTAPARTLIDKRVADRLLDPDHKYGPRRCVVWAGRRWCGETIRVTMTMPPCKLVAVDAIAADLQRNITPQQNAIAGRDWLDVRVESIDTATGKLTCRVAPRDRGRPHR